ncbi:OmpA family protein [Nonlabens ulvanivorans]|uniref:OmpA family protein n=1 Tax=Nonlabens ulvanivorans TaxID=906888 RepID=UPI0029424D69|nr:OmpA family protein [Nonlabens ulvanivorans]WOI22570.1 OmpA family protein [Nonlabens ulvanivorans]
MKNIFKILVACAVLLGASSANAQDEGNRWAISVGVNAIDLYPVGEADQGLGDYFEDFFDTDHYNILAAPSRVQVGYYIGDGIVATGAFSVNKIDKIGDTSIDDISYYSLDAGLEYNFRNLIKEDGVIAPFVGVGGGYVWLDENGFGTFNGTAGIDFYISDNIAFNLQTTYKHAFEDANPKHFQHTAGLKFTWGGTDTDGDGIYDDKDACPSVAGLEQFMGCPDSDGDGIEDSKDNCPNAAGPAESMGCPDTDGDGTLDKDDNCVNEAGPAYNNGCPDPDTDGDGVVDSKDNCKTVKGPASNNGCPTDRDNDGVLDADDKCPDTPGIASLAGCPKPAAPTVEEQEKLNQYAKTILFDTGKATIKAESAKVLADITAILKKYPTAKFSIDGHTDSVGSAKLNQRLSDSRANEVKNYLVANGIDEFRLSSVGYGEARPVADNGTKTGRSQNRRVEINLVN